MATKLSISELDAQIEKLKERRKLLIVKSAERFAHAATKAGLAEMELSDGELDGIVAEIAARFQKKTKDTAGASPQPYRPEAGRPGTPEAVSHDG
ncbi:TraC-like protein [Rhizobium mongolense subsp. loessense]|uniref:TraC-like protein n=1 Tax=Rhizobium mongolense subsp. loessense TaxID=158890 RepID=A0A1G4SB20_9HYPH|nr:TraC family protein [Rhizobium mongolense]SCW66413.1 TraC-like protein [Rhizobium mongolense subsp. loessense]